MAQYDVRAVPWPIIDPIHGDAIGNCHSRVSAPLAADTTLLQITWMHGVKVLEQYALLGKEMFIPLENLRTRHGLEPT